ncbi:MAG TPA: hypothetical protein VEX38_04715 [Fimbriimonadaceae bacterium]|nr:hypothetical protein [Fimbriimonadaceae bacterium]
MHYEVNEKGMRIWHGWEDYPVFGTFRWRDVQETYEHQGYLLFKLPEHRRVRIPWEAFETEEQKAFVLGLAVEAIADRTEARHAL